MAVNSSVARQNLLLNHLTDAELQPYLSQLSIVEHKLKDSLYQREAEIAHVYFPCTCVSSNIVYMEDGLGIEVGTIGNESFTGVELLLGATRAMETVTIQIPGISVRMGVDDFRSILQTRTPLQQLLQRAGQAYLFMVSQTGACNRLHQIEYRFARWLLIAHDRVRQDTLPLTQEFLAIMLGAQRPTVNLIASTFQKAGIIRYNRGQIEVLDRARLEDSACECYGKVRLMHERLLGIPRG
jgi:CRP-like cAMP-binding protein